MVKMRKEKSVRMLSDGNPSPLDFDTFFPWACIEFESPVIPVIRHTKQDELPIKKEVSPKASKHKDKIMKDSAGSPHSSGMTQNVPLSLTEFSYGSSRPSTYSIRAIYGKDGLTELQFNNLTLYRLMIQILGLCIPFHPELVKIIIRNSKIDIYTIYELSKLLPISNITDICLDGSTMPELSFYQLLPENVSTKLRYLSLCRCNINDAALKLIMERLNEKSLTSKTLMLLNLTSNQITDVGVDYINEVLRINRTLKYLNLSDNKITNRGCLVLFSILMEFKLNYDEIIKERQRRIEHNVTKNILYQKCLQKIYNYTSPPSVDTITSKLSKKKRGRSSLTNLKKSKKPSSSATVFSYLQSPNDSYLAKAEAMAAEILASDEFFQYDRPSTICRDGYICCVGNMALSYLNIAYNHFDYNTVLNLFDLLYYQSLIENKSGGTGLVKVVIEGNYIPVECEVLTEIQDLLEKKTAIRPVAKKPSKLSKSRN